MFFSQTAISSCGIAIGYATMEQNLWVRRCKIDKNGCLLLHDVIKIDDQNFVFLSIYNASIEKEELKTLAELKNMLNNNSEVKCIILGGDFNFYLDSRLETKSGNPPCKEKSVTMML